MNLNIQKLHGEAQEPVYSSDGAANFDLFAVVEQDINAEKPLIITPGTSAHIRTGLAFEVPAGYVLEVFSRSGHGFKSSTRLSNCVGQIDSDYRGEVMVALHNDGRKRFQVRHGDRIAQARLVPVIRSTFSVVDKLSETARGAGGFGSTGA